MASKRRIRRKACEGKIRFLTIQEANIQAYKHQRWGHRMRAYKCLFCNGYHIGHYGKGRNHYEVYGR